MIKSRMKTLAGLDTSVRRPVPDSSAPAPRNSAARGGIGVKSLGREEALRQMTQDGQRREQQRREKILADAKASEAEAAEQQRREEAAAAAGPSAPRPDFVKQLAAEALGL